MKKESKRLLAAAAILWIVVNLLDNDYSAMGDLSAGDLAPVLMITGVVFLLKTGAVAVVLALAKKLWDKFSGKA